MKKLLWLIVGGSVLWLATKILKWDFFLVASAIVLLGALSWTIGSTFFEAHERAAGHRRHYRDDDYEVDED